MISNVIYHKSRQRRNSSKNQIHVIFLAPFWNAQDASVSKMTNATDPYSVGMSYESIHAFEMFLFRYLPLTNSSIPHNKTKI